MLDRICMQGKVRRHLYITICRSYDILSVWFWRRTETGHSDKQFPIFATMFSSKEPVSLHTNKITYLLEYQKVIKDYSHPTHQFNFSVPVELHLFMYSFSEETYLLRGGIEFLIIIWPSVGRSPAQLVYDKAFDKQKQKTNLVTVQTVHKLLLQKYFSICRQNIYMLN